MPSRPVRPRTSLPSFFFLAAVFMLSARAAGAQAPSPVQTPVKLAGKTCVTVVDAVNDPNRDICVSVHVYNLVEMADGTRFLDVCPPEVADAQCRFTLLSLPADRDEVGDLRQYLDKDVALRGVVRTTHGRMGMVISHLRQFRGGPEKFRPNPKLLKGFDAQADRNPVRDPNLASSGRHRSFMNSSTQEPLPSTAKHD